MKQNTWVIIALGAVVLLLSWRSTPAAASAGARANGGTIGGLFQGLGGLFSGLGGSQYSGAYADYAPGGTFGGGGEVFQLNPSAPTYGIDVGIGGGFAT